MPKRIIVIGTSAGGIEAIQRIVRGLPKDLDASLFIVIHTPPDAPGVLHRLLNRWSELTAIIPKDRERIRAGFIYVAAPDHHLLVEPGVVRLSRGPKENRFRPAVDPLFRSAAQTYGPKVIGVILTGGLDDGTAGLLAVKQLGGTAIVQDPQDAMFDGMPRSALNYVNVDYCVRLAEVAPLLVQLTQERVAEGDFKMPEEMKIETDIANEKSAMDAGILKLGEPSIFSCPECHGVLLKMRNAEPPRFRCHTGHAYSTESLLSEIEEKIGESLWNAVRALEEAVLLQRHMAEHVRQGVNQEIIDDLLNNAMETQRRVELVRKAALWAGESSD